MDERYRYITKISRNLELAKRKDDSNFFSSTEEIAIHLIRHNKGISQERLSSLLGVDKALTTRLVRKLIDGGFVERRKSQSDKRSYELYPTDFVQSIKKDVVSFEEHYYEEVFEAFTVDEKEEFLNLLTKLYVKSKSMRKQGR